MPSQHEIENMPNIWTHAGHYVAAPEAPLDVGQSWKLLGVTWPKGDTRRPNVVDVQVRARGSYNRTLVYRCHDDSFVLSPAFDDFRDGGGDPRLLRRNVNALIDEVHSLRTSDQQPRRARPSPKERAKHIAA